MSEDLHRRSGLGKVGLKLGQDIGVIAYLGNSVTAQRESYRLPLHEHLVSHFGRPHRAINAGLGGMGSIGMLFMLPDLVLRHKPDLCFIECTTGDMGTNPPLRSIGPVVEGMLRKLIAAGSAVCILHLFRVGSSFDETSPILSRYERVAEHYQIPTLNVGRAFERAIVSNGRHVSQILRDGVHTTAEGAKMTADFIADAVIELCGMPPCHGKTLPAPMHDDHYEFASIVPASQAKLAKAERHRLGRFRLVCPYVEIKSDNEIVFTAISGRVAGMLVVVGIHSGFINVRVNSKNSEYQIWDQWCDRDRLQTLIFTNSVPAGTTIHISVPDKGVPAAASAPPGVENSPRKALKLVGFLIHNSDAAADTIEGKLR
jgi:hypothetical protein